MLGCGVALLPSDRAQQTQLLAQAAQVASFVHSYCEREQAKCDQAAKLWDGAKDKAAVAGRLALDVSKKYAPGSALAAAPEPLTLDDLAQGVVSVATHASAIAVPPVAARQLANDTLSRADLIPAWRGPAPR